MLEQKVFTNQSQTNISSAVIKKILINPLRLVEWVPEITKVIPQQDMYCVIRAQLLTNSNELISLITKENQIIYKSQQNIINYRLVWTITEESQHTLVQEDLYIAASDSIDFIKPILKSALAANLQRLLQLAQTMEK